MVSYVSTSQLFIIFLAFITFSPTNLGGLKSTAKALANLIMVLSFGLNIKGFTFILDAAFRALGNLRVGLQEQLVDKEKEIEKEEIQNLIRDVEKTGPFSGLGYFEITKSTLVSMASVSITYIIILVQFRQA